MLHSPWTRRGVSLIAAVAVLAFAGTACGDDNGSSSSGTTDAAAESSGTRATADVLLDADTETILDQPVEILAVNFGAAGVENTVEDPVP